jgi:hypothetical protein
MDREQQDAKLRRISDCPDECVFSTAVVDHIVAETYKALIIPWNAAAAA